MDIISDPESDGVLKELHRINWALAPEEVSKTLIDNYKTLQSSLPVTDSEGKHGILPIKSSRFDRVLIADETPFQVDIESTEPTYAIPMTAEVAIISPTNPDIAVIFGLATDKDDKNTYGSRIIISKFGTAQDESKKFVSEIVTDPDKMETAQNLRRQNMRFNLNLEEAFDRDIEISKLEKEAIKIVSKDYEAISPTMDSYTDIEVEFSDLAFKVLGVENTFIIIQPTKPFLIQDFTK